MTWHSFFDVSTIQHRHILATYCGIILINAAVFARLVYSWTHPKP
jgi:hypothetical protein